MVASKNSSFRDQINVTQVVWHKDVLLDHPANGTSVFGYLPEIRVHRGPTLKAGPIVLKYGQHVDNGRGFGFEHVWKGHYRQITDHEEAMTRVRNVVADCLSGIVTVHYEQVSRIETLRFNVGNLILQSQPGPNHYYSVVSGGYLRTAKGVKVARLDPTKKGP